MRRINNILATALILLGVACCIVSTYATINPIQQAFKGDVKYIMIGLFVIVQISVFFLAMTKHHIEKEAPQHYLLVSRISNLLMVVSIISTITFFNMNKHVVTEHAESIKEIFNIIPYVSSFAFYNWLVNITTDIVFVWSVCVLLDVMAIKLPPVGFDLLAGIKHRRRQHSIFGMLIAILTYKPKTAIENKYKKLYKLEQIEQPEVKTELKQELKTGLTQQKVDTQTKVVTPPEENNLKLNSNVVVLDKGKKNPEQKVEKYIIEQYKNGDVVQVKNVRDKFDLTARQWAGVRDKLDILTTRGTKTIVNVEEREKALV